MTERMPAGGPKAAPDKPTERSINRRMAQIESMIRIAFKERRPPERKNMEATLLEIAALLQSDMPDKINSAVYKMDFLEQEFTSLYIHPAVKSRLIVLWVTMAVLCCVTHGLIGEHALAYYMDQEHILPSFSGPIAGHVLDFMPLRYLLYGAYFSTVVMATYGALGVNYSNYADFTSLSRSSLINCTLSIVVTYLIVRLIKADALALTIFGFKLDGGAASLFVIATAVSLATERHTKGLLDLANRSVGRRV